MLTSTFRVVTRVAAAGLFTCLTVAASAQNVSLKGDVITVDKQPYGKLTKSGGLLKDFTLLTLDGTEVAKAQGKITQLPNNETFVYYMLTFQPGGETAEMSKSGMNFAQQLAEAFVKNEVLREGKPNPEGITRFTAAYGEKLSAKYAAQASEQANAKPLQYSTVNRNRMGAGAPSIEYNKRTKRTEIRQSGTVIGYLNPGSQEKGRANFTVTLPDGMTIAEFAVEAWMADSPGARDISYKLLVKKNNQYHTRTAVGGVSAAQQDAVQYLVTGGYL
ncbi:hypothetical protein [Hymenobacter sp. CRA2]|uniref:hypothetical protein n=1 Tax=Hymenobacter sp. CRA2 TaxID=1955620 RepID=UPI00098F1F9C|nr:hypothetical protein [Hymenobacter sp. CRA2]OON66878.1 hypothetical protein B0919_21195 [Hymenobacter sp. CRA2]